MRSSHTHFPAFAATALLLAGCGGTDQAGPQNDVAAAPEQQGRVERTEVRPPEPVRPLEQAAIQVQPGPQGSQVTLNRASVTGDVLTVQLTYVGERGFDYAPLSEVSLIDDATAQRIGVLRDNEGNWLASPLDTGGNRMRINLHRSPAIVWFKFPAPPPESGTVSINIPNVAPFDGVPVTR